MKRHRSFHRACLITAMTALVVTAMVNLGAQRGGANVTGVVNLGPVRISKAVKADGKPLPAGTYQVRLTAEEAKPDAPGQTPPLERWAEFMQGGQVRGREVVTVVPASDIGAVAEGKPPANGSYKVELLKGDDYLRVWINRGGQHYLIHLPV